MTDEEKRKRVAWIGTWIRERASIRKCQEYEQRFLMTLLETLQEMVTPEAYESLSQLKTDYTNFELVRLQHTVDFWTDAETRLEEERKALLAELGQADD